MGITISPASKEEIPEILELLYQLGRPKPEDASDLELFKYMIKKFIKENDKDILVAKEDSKVIGMTSIMFLTRLNQNRPEMYIPELIVAKDFQNQGIGKRIIEECSSIAREKNCHRIRLESGNQRTDSHEFYKKIGFEQSGLSFTKALD